MTIKAIGPMFPAPRGRIPHPLAALVCLSLSLASTSPARADEAASTGPINVIVSVDGEGASGIRTALVETLPGTPRIVDDEAFRDALAKEKMTRPLSTIVEVPAKRRAVVALLNAAMHTTNAAYAVVAHGKVAGKGTRTRSAHVLVLERGKTEPLVEREVTLPGKGGAGDVQAMKDALAAALEPLAPPPPPVKREEVTPPPPPPPVAVVAPPVAASPAAAVAEAEDHSIDGGRPLLVVSVGAELAGRFFDYNQPISKNLRSYRLPLTALIAADVEVYPLARTRIPVVRDLGLVGSYARSLSIKSVPEGGGDTVSSAWTRFDAGLRFRYRVPAWRRPVFGVTASYGGFLFSYDAPAALAAELPTVDNRFIRFGLDGRIGFGRLSVFARGGYRVILSSGALGDRFPREQVGGIDVGAGVAVAIVSGLEARLLGDYTRTFYDFRPEPGDGHVAGGALDQQYGARLALAYAF